MGFRFRPRLLPTLAAILLIALFSWLGFWQLDRAAYKEHLWTRFGQVGEAERIAVDGIGDLAPLKRYTPVRVTGWYDASRQILLDNRIHEGRVGVYVFTPLHIDGGVLLVNRGWLPLRKRGDPPDPAAPQGRVTVRGLVSPPPPAGVVLGEVRLPPEWPWLTPYFIIEKVNQAFDAEVAPQVLLLAPAAPGGFIREWEPGTLPPARHVGYAVQWFALALAVLVAWIVVNVRRAGRAGD